AVRLLRGRPRLGLVVLGRGVVRSVVAGPAGVVVPGVVGAGVVTAVAAVGSGVVSVPAVGVQVRRERGVAVWVCPASTGQPGEGSLLHACTPGARRNCSAPRLAGVV